MSTAEAFQHRPLDLTQPGIRVLDLLPLQADGAIRCRLRHDVLGPSLQFSAVSYEWGSLVSGKHEIYIDDMSFQVHHNLLLLLTALLNIYPTDGYKSLWIDALCIDQLNIGEKNHQVQQMKNIYQTAANVLVWLGPSDDKTDRLFDFLQDLCIPDSAENAARSVAQLTLEQWKHYQDKVFGAGVPVWEACEALSKRTYWSRTWILQEILLANQPLIFCGDNKVPWQAWAILLDTLDKNPVEFVKIWAPDIWGSPAMSVSREWFALIDEGPRENLIQLTTAFRKSECSILQDKVYGLLGLLSGGSKLLVDYDREIEDLLLDLLEMTTSDTTISDVENLLEMFEINTLSSIQMALDCVYAGKRPIAQSSGWLKIGAILKGTNAAKDISSRVHLRQLRWCNQLESQQLIWRFTSPCDLDSWSSGRWKDLQPPFLKSNLLTHARDGRVMKCQCPRCCAKLNTSTVGSRLFKVLSALSYKDTARDLEGYSAALLYRRLSGKDTYFATLVNVRETSTMLLFYDPVTVEEIQPARSATGSLARTLNLIAHQHSPLSLESASPLAECRIIQLGKSGQDLKHYEKGQSALMRGNRPSQDLSEVAGRPLGALERMRPRVFSAFPNPWSSLKR